jgi:outer membrane protein assembly factor BamE (lipoprotein component of BamABCDE complex)
LFIAAALFAIMLLASAHAQKATQKQAALASAQVEQPRYTEYRGVRLGMTAEQVTQKLGAPKETGDRQDFYVFSEYESAQVFYDAQHVVTAVSANYLGEQSGAPTPEKVFGSPAEVKPDGSIYKMVRYTQAGYFVVYSRTPGDAPLVMITMQKIID